MPLKYKSRTRIPKTYDLDWDKIFDDLNASGELREPVEPT